MSQLQASQPEKSYLLQWPEDQTQWAERQAPGLLDKIEEGLKNISTKKIERTSAWDVIANAYSPERQAINDELERAEEELQHLNAENPGAIGQALAGHEITEVKERINKTVIKFCDCETALYNSSAHTMLENMMYTVLDQKETIEKSLALNESVMQSTQTLDRPLPVNIFKIDWVKPLLRDLFGSASKGPATQPAQSSETKTVPSSRTRPH